MAFKPYQDQYAKKKCPRQLRKKNSLVNLHGDDKRTLMSLGHGVVQRAIIDAVSTHPGRSAAQVRWGVAEQLLGKRASQQDLPPAYYGAFQRARRRLLLSGELVGEKRHYSDFGQIVRLYPFATRNARIRSLREILLPVIADVIRDAPPQFTDVETETHVLMDKVLTIAEQKRARQLWTHVDRALVRKLEVGGAHATTILIELLARGRELFTPRLGFRLKCCLSEIHKRLEPFAKKDPDLESVDVALGQLRREFLAVEDLARSELKREVYLAVHFPRHGAPSLDGQVKAKLLSRCPEVIRGLPDHVDPAPGWDPHLPRYSHSPTFSPMLDQLIDRHVLRQVEFLMVAA